MKIEKEKLNNFNESLKKEWLITNGLGGFASSTIIGCNTRKYHGLLLSELDKKDSRYLLVSKINEVVYMNNEKFDLSTNQCIDYISNGYEYQSEFEYDKFPKFTYTIDDNIITKEICMKHLENTTIVKYNITTGMNNIKMDFMPLLNNRDLHSTSYSYIEYPQIEINGGIKIIYDTDNSLYIYTNSDSYEKFNDANYNNMYYSVEQERGLDCLENHFMPGSFKIVVPPFSTKTIYFCLSTKPQKDIDIDGIFENEISRQNRILDKAGMYDTSANRLVLASDQFIIKDEDDNYGIIAGYPWFGKWGRDTFISFEGLLLVTKRFDIAKNILENAINNIKDGLMPNQLNNKNNDCSYNTVDSSLLFFEALHKYLKYTNDYTLINKKYYSVLKDILVNYNDGTLYNIHVDPKDGLLSCGDSKTNLTWMDAMIDNMPVTPRHGKCVEINALWYNALNVMLDIINYKYPKVYEMDYKMFEHWSKKCKKSFEEKFWDTNRNCLYDTIEPYSLDIRPNQVLSMSLSYPIFDNENAKIMLNTVQEQLYTPYGLRTLSPYSKKYIGKYSGGVISRDNAYHQGTVWTWLLSEFIIAFCRINKYSLADRKRWISYIEVIQQNMDDHCINQLSEIFDGDEPHLPNGAFAQAWSVGNILKLFSEVE